ncbi:MAG TPA: hypothetical protein VFO25_02550 [Candidatus Eremiobacteraceae bacterium]|nr:hypothetical protein [Candidatus Eremiobacteraceae bacterium]
MQHAVSPLIEALWRIGIVGLIGLGVWIVFRCGRVMLGNAAFAAIAAAATAALVARGTADLVAVVAGVLAAATCGAAFGFAAARATPTGFAIASLALWAVELSVRAPAGAALRSAGSPVFVVIAVAGAAVAAWFYARSRNGLAAAAIGQDERAAQGIGIDPMRVRVTAVTLGALLAGVAGSLSVFYPGFDITAYRLHGDVAAFAAVVLGGADFSFGPLVGAVLVAIAAVAPFTKEHAAAVNAVALLAATIVLPGGIASIFSRAARR